MRLTEPVIGDAAQAVAASVGTLEETEGPGRLLAAVGAAARNGM